MAPIEKHMRIVIFKWAPIRCTPSTRVDLSTDDDRPDKIRPPSRYRNMYESMSTYRVKTATARHDPHIASTHVAIFATATGRSQRCLTASGHRYSVCHLVVRDGNGCYRHSQSPIQIERGLRLFCFTETQGCSSSTTVSSSSSSSWNDQRGNHCVSMAQLTLVIIRRVVSCCVVRTVRSI